MARIRTIKPDFWRDEALSALPPETTLLAIGLLNHADDEGYFNAHPKLIESDVFPLRELSRSVTVMLDELHSIGYIEVFKGADGKRYGHIVNFSKHQVINKKNTSKIKDLCGVQENYGTTTVVLPVGKEWKGMEEEKKKEPTTRGTRLPADATLSPEYRDFCQKTRPELNPDQLFEGFRDYWIAQPGQKGVKLDWFATWRTWVRNQKVTQTSTVSKKPNFGSAV